MRLIYNRTRQYFIFILHAPHNESENEIEENNEQASVAVIYHRDYQIKVKQGLERDSTVFSISFLFFSQSVTNTSLHSICYLFAMTAHRLTVERMKRMCVCVCGTVWWPTRVGNVYEVNQTRTKNNKMVK